MYYKINFLCVLGKSFDFESVASWIKLNVTMHQSLFSFLKFVYSDWSPFYGPMLTSLSHFG